MSEHLIPSDPQVISTWLNTDGHEAFVIFSHHAVMFNTQFYCGSFANFKISLIPEGNFLYCIKKALECPQPMEAGASPGPTLPPSKS